MREYQEERHPPRCLGVNLRSPRDKPTGAVAPLADSETDLHQHKTAAAPRSAAFNILIIIALFTLLASSATAANDPGHDTLYVLKVGDSEVQGSINLTGNVTAQLVRVSDKVFGDYLDIAANGTTDLGAFSTASRITAGSNALYIDSPQNLYINTKGGTSGIIQVGKTTTNGVILNVSGNITQRGIAVCLADGTNCPGGTNTGNVSSVNAGNGISVNQNTGAVTVSTSATTCNAGEYSYWDGNSWECRADQNGAGTISGGGNSGNLSYWTGANSIGNSTLYQNGSYIGLGTTTPTGEFEVHNGAGNTNVGITASGSYASIYFVPAVNGIGSISYNHKFQIGTSAAVGGGIASALLMDSSGNVGIGTTAPTQKLDVNGSLNVSGTGATIYVGNTPVCLANGTNCASTAGGSGWINSSTLVRLANNATNVSIGNMTGNNPLLFIDSTHSRIGIGTTLTANTLDVNGSGYFYGSLGVGSSLYVNPPGGSNGMYFGDAGMIGSPEVGMYDAGGDQLIAGYSEALDTYMYGNGMILANASSGGVDSMTPGGGITIQASAGAPASAELPGNGGNITITAGQGGENQGMVGSGGDGGSVLITSGVGGTGFDSDAHGDYGSIYLITGGVANGAGNVYAQTFLFNISGNAAIGGRVGIGTQVTTAALTVNSSSVEGSLLIRNSTATHLFINGSTGNVGIGTITPTQKLDVTGSINVSGAGSTIYVGNTQVCLANGTGCAPINGASAAGGWLNSSSLVRLANNGTNVSIGNTTGNIPLLHMDNTGGKIGIGTTTPASAFTVNNTALAGSFLVQNSTNTHLSINSSGFISIGTMTQNLSNDGRWVEKLFINATDTSTDNTTYAKSEVAIEYVVNPSANHNVNARREGLLTEITVPNSSTKALGYLQGIAGDANNYGGGNVTGITGMSGWGYNGPLVVNNVTTLAGVWAGAENDAGNVTNMMLYNSWGAIYGGYVQNVYGMKLYTSIGTDQAANRYGVYIDGAGTATNDYGLYQASSSQKNYFAGNVGIGTTTPTDGSLVVYGSSPVLSLQNSNGNGGTGGVLRFGHDQSGSALPVAEIRSNLTSGAGAGSRSGHLQFYTSVSGVLSNRMTITDGGNIIVGTGTPGNATGAGDLYVTSDIEYDGNLYGPGADLAELIDASGTLEAGDIVVADPSSDETVMRSTGSYSTAVVGVVSSDPGIILSKSKGSVPLALSGRVPMKASAENGPIRPGDLLTTSSTPGYAMRCASAQACQGAIVGKSLGTLEAGTGKITGLVMLG